MNNDCTRTWLRQSSSDKVSWPSWSAKCPYRFTSELTNSRPSIYTLTAAAAAAAAAERAAWR